MKNIFKLMGLCLILSSFSACEKESKAEDAMEQAGDRIEDAGDAVEDKVD